MSKENLKTLTGLNAKKIFEIGKKQFEAEQKTILREFLKDIQPIIKRRNELLKKMKNCSKCESMTFKFVPCKKHVQKLIEIDNELEKIKLSYKLAGQLQNLK